jgi:molybdate transport system regulatory protein
MSTRLTIRLDFDAGRRLGAGKVALLESIDTTGSISAAGRAQGMSYRRAWLLVDDLNQLFVAPLVSAHHGGAKGGGAALTDEGRRIVTLYRDAEAKMRLAAQPEIDSIERGLASPPRPPRQQATDTEPSTAPLTSSSRRARTA